MHIRTHPADWISDRRALIDAATEGPWEAEPLEGNIVTPARGTIIEVSRWTDADAALIADSRTSLPAALDALEAVLARVQDEGYCPTNACPHADCHLAHEIEDDLAAALGVEVQS